ncbi:RnfABCDGE type electron transport complex subunit G [Halomonas sp. V046]|uniref:RnfABCDGE type electron transport complex subunit G n=1 Tax=Halomonas sp. V046 TaxID=3459611 RepID=UPI00404417A7
MSDRPDSPLQSGAKSGAKSGVKAGAKAALGLAAFAVICVGSIAVTRALTQDHIQTNRDASQTRLLQALVPATTASIARDSGRTTAPGAERPQAPVSWIARDAEDKLLARVYPASSDDGYSGHIALLVGITAESTITAVRVTEHRETPGLGDIIETRKSDWIRQFDGLSLHDLALAPDGAIDAITGATITSRAVTHAVRDALTNRTQDFPEAGQ